MITKHIPKLSSGYTLIELLIVAGIMAALAGTVTVSFRAIRSGHEINTARADTISKLRQIQSYVLNGKIVPGMTEAADAYELVLATNSNTYQIYADINGTLSLLETARYSAIGGNVRLNTMTVNGVATSTVTVRITAPYGTILVGGQPYQVVNLVLSQSSGQTKDFVIDGVSGRLAATGVTPPPPTVPVNFSISNSGPIVLNQGLGGSNTITATHIAGSTHQAVFFTASGVPTGATATFSATACNPDCTLNFSISTTSATPVGEYNITVTGTSGSIIQTTTFTLTVKGPFDFSLTNSGNIDLLRGDDATNLITATLGFTDDTFPVTFSVSGVPAGTNVNFSIPSCSPTCNTTLSIDTTPSTPYGPYTITVTGTYLSLVKNTTFTLYVHAPFDFSMSNSGALSLVSGTSGNRSATATIVPFAATESVSFTYTGVPANTTSGLSVPSCSPTCSTTLTIGTTGNTPLGNHTITITGTSATLVRTTNLTLTVTPVPPVLISASATGQTTAQVSWTDNTAFETDNAIEKGPSGGSCTGFSTHSSFGVRGGGNQTDNLSGLSGETQYCLRIRTDWSGGSVYSSTAVIQTWLNPPATFTLANGGNNKVLLTWANSSNVETGYAIEYYCTGDSDCPTAFTALVTQPANSTSYSHSISGTISDGALMYYRIRSVGSSSNSVWVTPTPAFFAKP